MRTDFFVILFYLIPFIGCAQQTGKHSKEIEAKGIFYAFIKNNSDTIAIGEFKAGREHAFYYEGERYTYQYRKDEQGAIVCTVNLNNNLIANFSMMQVGDSSFRVKRNYFYKEKVIDSVSSWIKLNDKFRVLFPIKHVYQLPASFFENAFSWQYNDDNVNQWNSGLLPDWSYADYRQSPFFIGTKILEERDTAFGDYQNHFFVYDDEGILQEHIIKRTPDAPDAIFKKRIVKQAASSLVYKITDNTQLLEPKNAMEYVSKDGMQDSVVTQYVRNHRNRSDSKLITVSRVRKMDDGGTQLYTRVNDKATYTEKRPITEEAAKKIIEKWKQPSQKK